MRIKTKKNRIALIVFLSLLGLFIIYNIIWALYINNTILPLINSLPNKNYSFFDYLSYDPDDPYRSTYDEDMPTYNDREKTLYYKIHLPKYLHFDYDLSISYSPLNDNTMTLNTPSGRVVYRVSCSPFRETKYMCAIGCIQEILGEGEKAYISSMIIYDIYVDKNGEPLENLDGLEAEIFLAKKDKVIMLKQLFNDMWEHNE